MLLITNNCDDFVCFKQLAYTHPHSILSSEPLHFFPEQLGFENDTDISLQSTCDFHLKCNFKHFTTQQKQWFFTNGTIDGTKEQKTI